MVSLPISYNKTSTLYKRQRLYLTSEYFFCNFAVTKGCLINTAKRTWDLLLDASFILVFVKVFVRFWILKILTKSPGSMQSLVLLVAS